MYVKILGTNTQVLKNPRVAQDVDPQSLETGGQKEP